MGKLSTFLTWRALTRKTAQEILNHVYGLISELGKSNNLYDIGRRKAYQQVTHYLETRYGVKKDERIRRWREDK